MAERIYQGASIGITRLNQVIKFARGRKFVTVFDVYKHLECSHKTAKAYLRELMESGRMTMLPPLYHNSQRKFMLVAGAELLPVPEPVWGVRKSRARPGAVKGRPRQHWPVEKDKAPRRIEIRPAEQVGIQRGPLIAAIFGGARC